MRKQIHFSNKIPDTSLYLLGVIGIPILIFMLIKNFWIALLCFAFLVFFYLRMGKLKTYDGEIVYVFGLPRSGKSSFLAKVAKDNFGKKYICVNENFEHCLVKDAVIKRDDIGKYRFGSPEKSAILLYDEVSLDGFDNRNFKTNFSGKNGEKVLKGFKMSGHRYQSIILANQGYNEVDSKIREGLCHSAYWVKDKGRYSVAIKLSKDIRIDELTGQPRDEYLKPNFFNRLIDPSCYIYINHKKYGKYFDTHSDESIPFYFAGSAAAEPANTESAKKMADDVINNALNSVLNNDNKEGVSK